MNKIKLIVVITVFVLIVLGVVFWYWQNKKVKQLSIPGPSSRISEKTQSPTPASGFGGQIFEKTQNPIKNVLPSNPFSNYKNPFSR